MSSSLSLPLPADWARWIPSPDSSLNLSSGAATAALIINQCFRFPYLSGLAQESLGCKHECLSVCKRNRSRPIAIGPIVPGETASKCRKQRTQNTHTTYASGPCESRTLRSVALLSSASASMGTLRTCGEHEHASRASCNVKSEVESGAEIAQIAKKLINMISKNICCFVCLPYMHHHLCSLAFQ